MIKSRKRIPFESSVSIFKNKTYQFVYSHALEPHPDKIQKGGQDALFASKNVLALADGVGAWKDLGIDAGQYSKQLINIMQNLLLDQQKRKYYIENPQKLVSSAVNINTLKGSTTISIITLHPTTGIVRTYYLGDSLYGIFTLDEPPILSKQQQNSFNSPYQVGSNFLHENQHMQFCNPLHGIYNQFSYQQLHQKVIVLASDGLWDNLFPFQIDKIIHENIRQQKENENIDALDRIVNNLVQQIKQTFYRQVYQSPFYFKGIKAGLQIKKYAKIDDISLIVAKIILNEGQEQNKKPQIKQQT